MIFFGKKRKHRLPKFPPHVIPGFEGLCERIDDTRFKELVDAVSKHFEVAENAEDIETNFNQSDANDIYQCCKYLISIYPQKSPTHQELIVGALRYSASTDDPFCDHTFASGMTDDKQVLNYVLEELGIEDRYLFVN